MPFSPLPRTFLDDLIRHATGRVVELGCGDGAFARLLAPVGLRPLLLDRRRPIAGSAAGVVADALHPPLPPASVQLLLAANLLRHVARPGPGRPVPPVWRELVAPGGSLYIFEDEPADAPAAVRNYRDLQAYLAGVAPGQRRPLLSARDFRRACGDGKGPGDVAGAWTFGCERNTWPSDAPAVLRMLAGGGRVEAGGAAARLQSAIAASGLDYGYYWWACWHREES